MDPFAAYRYEFIFRALRVFDERRLWEERALKQALSHGATRARVIAELQRELAAMRLASTDEEFIQIDTRFHQAILAHSPCASPQQAFVLLAPIAVYGTPSIQIRENRDRVCAEHEGIIVALQSGDEDTLFKAVRSHFEEAKKRWFPDMRTTTANGCIPYYERLQGPASALWFCSLNEEPVEFQPAYWDTIGRAAARALRRGATLLYVRPAQKLIDSLRQMGFDDDVFEEALIRKHFKAFRAHVLEELHRSERYASKSLIEMIVDQRLLLFCVRKPPVFMRANHTFGCFLPDCSEARQSLLTQREQISDGSVWPIITSVHDAQQRAQFRHAIRQAIKEVAKKGQGTEQATAQRLLATWFPEKL